MSGTDFILLFGNRIGYTDVLYYLLLFAAVILYYLFPKKWRWVVLLAASGIFYCWLFPEVRQAVLFGSTIILSWGFALLFEYYEKRFGKPGRAVFFIAAAVTVFPLLLMDIGKAWESFTGNPLPIKNIIIPVGLSFYTLQIIAYLADVYRKKISAQKNLFKYALFISFFPQLLQGPIPRYGDLSDQLTNGNDFDPDHIHRGFQLILWGFFLKLMIADRAMVIVDTVFNAPKNYPGCYILAAGTLYSLQLYTDFMACTTLSQGASILFGIRLSDNFMRPYFSDSVREFWRRWHMSLSGWLRDYVYIPLGGSRKGKIRKNINLLLTFLVSGFWHGGSLNFIVWGLVHGCYQIIGSLTIKIRDRIWLFLGFDRSSRIKKCFRMIGTAFLVMLAWILFRAEDLSKGVSMIRSVFAEFNPWVLTGESVFKLGLSWIECFVLALSVLILFGVSVCRENKISIGERIMKTPVLFRYLFYVTAIIVIMIFGSYGFGFNASDFIYRGF